MSDLARVDDKPIQFTDEQTRLIRNTYANGASEHEFSVFMEICRARRLNPLMRQVYFVSRWDSTKKTNIWQPQISIDGMRAVAERTGKYAGQDEPEFIYGEDGGIRCAKVRVYRKDWGNRPAVGVAFWDEYVQRTKEGETTRMWKTMGHTMLAKCAESQALRKAFPEDLSGLYSPEEMAQASNEQRVTVTEDGEVIENALSKDQIMQLSSDILNSDLDRLYQLATDVARLAKDKKITPDQRDGLRKLWKQRKDQLDAEDGEAA